jgi:pSer/pThr/pTyr-binding forkhead associated (FHA) protein
MNIVNQLIWIIPMTLVALILVQILYLLWLRYAPIRSKAPAPRPQSNRSTSSAPAAVAPMAVTPPPFAASTSTPSTNIPTSSRAATGEETTTEAVNKFVVLSGLQGVKEIRLPGNEFRIGRYYNLEGNILVGFDEKSVSRKHAQLTLDYNRREYYLTDTDSSYGTYLLVEGATEQLTPRERKRIYNGDVIRFGNLVTVRLSIIGETRASTTRI